MGTFIKGILGGFSGKIGTVIGSTWRSLDVMKSLPKKSSKPPVQSQIDQRFIFSMVVAFLAKMERAVAIGFRNSTGAKTPMNEAVSLNISNAVIGSSPNFSIDYTRVVLSTGSLDTALDADIQPAAGRLVNVTWTPETGDPADPAVISGNSDKAVLVIYNPARKIVMRVDTATRGVATVQARMPFVFDGTNHAWLFFAQTKGKKVSDSQYLGTVVVAD
jgi:hypothetical protein